MQSGSSQGFLEDSIKLSFSFWMARQSLCITTKTFIDHPIVALRFSEHPQFQNTLNRGNLSFHHTHTAMYCICGTTTGSCTTLSSTIGKLNNSISQTSVLSRPYFSFGLFSCPFLHPCSSISPTLHHLVLTTASSFLSESISTPKHCKGASTSPKRFGKFFPFVSLCQFFAQAMLHITLSFVCLSFMCSSLMTRTAVTLSATLLLYSSNFLSCLSTILSENIPEQLLLFLQIFPINKRVPKRRSGKILIF